MRIRELITAVASLTIAGTLLAQTTASLSGVWIIDRDKTTARSGARAGAPGGGALAGGGSISPAGAAPIEWTITQTTAAVIIERSALPGGAAQKFVYKLDGTDSVNVNVRTTLTTKTRWDAGKLVTEGTQITTTDQGDVKGTFKEVRSIQKDGSMVVETQRQLDTAGPTTSIQVLVKKPK